MMSRWLVAVLLVVAALLTPSIVAAQGRPGRAGGAGAGDPPEGVSPAEIQRMFDAYALLQAQDQLKIGDDQFPKFLPRFKALQDVRRTMLVERARIIAQLRRLVNQGGSESEIKERLGALQDLETKFVADVKKAYEAIDQVLDVQQQAKFRVFEEMMERRKLDLVTRARNANKPK